MVDGELNIIGVTELRHLPAEWPMLFEDVYDRDGDGIAGRVRFVSGNGAPMIGKWGASLAAARFEDFAKIAGAAHDIDVSEDMGAIYALFAQLSPRPPAPFATDTDRQKFVSRGCSACHVTQSYTFDGRPITPLSDFLLHDLGDGETRTTPIWACTGRCLDFTHEQQ